MWRSHALRHSGRVPQRAGGRHRAWHLLLHLHRRPADERRILAADGLSGGTTPQKPHHYQRRRAASAARQTAGGVDGSLSLVKNERMKSEKCDLLLMNGGLAPVNSIFHSFTLHFYRFRLQNNMGVYRFSCQILEPFFRS